MKKKRLVLVLCLAVFAAAALGCAAPDVAEPPASASSAAAEKTAGGQAVLPAEESVPAVAETREITDMAGRTVVIPAKVNAALGTDPVGTITLYTLAPDKLVGWNYEFNDREKEYIPAEYLDLPVFGMKDSLNAEAVIAAAPDVVVQMGATNEAAAKQADELQERLNIPVVVLSGKLLDTPAAYEQLGIVTGDTDRATELGMYAQAVLDRAQDMREEIPSMARVTVYYGNGPDSLETAPNGSDAAEVVELAGGINVADLDVEDPSERVNISKEQLIAWDPNVIFVNGEPKEDLSGNGAAQSILADPDLSVLDAVQSGSVYGIPKSPFAWLDRPKAGNRIIGVVWAGTVMYPELYEDIDVSQEIRDFYDLFYHVQLSGEQADALLHS